MKEKKVHFSTLQTRNNYFTTLALFIKPGRLFTFSTNKPKAVSTWANMPSNATKSIWPADIFGVSSTEPFLGWINSPYWAWSILEQKKKELKPHSLFSWCLRPSHLNKKALPLVPSNLFYRIYFPTYILSVIYWVPSSEKAMATHSSTLAWKIPWTEEPDRLQSMGSLRVSHDWATSLSLFTFMHWRRKWQPTPVFLPGESQGRGRLVGCHLWGCTKSDTTEAT